MSKQNRVLGLIAATLVACGGNNIQTDAGPIPVDGGAPDVGSDGGGGGSVCATPIRVTLTPGAPVSAMGDTTGHTSGLVMLGAMCGGGTAGPQMAEQVVELTLPGSPSDMVAVRFSFLNAGTSTMFDTTVEVRTSCMTAGTTMDCFDDSSATAGDYRTDGVFTAPGGSTRFLVVTGFRAPLMGYTNVGPWKVDFTTYVNPTAPTLTAATASLLDGDYLTVEAMGMDPQSAASGVNFSFLDAANTPIGVDLDMMTATPLVTEFGTYVFRPGVLGMMNYDGTARITGWGTTAALLNATQLRLSVSDAAGLTSNEITIPLVQAVTVHVGATCDAAHRCATGVDCAGTPTVCTVPAAVATACTAATPITIATPTTTATMATASVMVGTGMGLLEGSCMGTGGMGDERIFSVTVPTGTFDLIAETPDMAEMGFDSVVYDRTVCGDPSTETQCNDDRSAAPMPHVLASLITVRNAAPGTHFIVVDAFKTLVAADPATTTLTVRLRPVLGTGIACDPAGITNRCMTGMCPASGAAMCP